MPRMTKAAREADARFDAAVDWLIGQVDMDTEKTFRGLAEGWLTEDEANCGITEDGLTIREAYEANRSN